MSQNPVKLPYRGSENLSSLPGGTSWGGTLGPTPEVLQKTFRAFAHTHPLLGNTSDGPETEDGPSPLMHAQKATVLGKDRERAALSLQSRCGERVRDEACLEPGRRGRKPGGPL